MAKESGLGANLYIDGVDVSGDAGQVNNISKSLATLPVTGIDKSAMERIAGKLDGRIQAQFWFNPTNAHPALANPPRTDSVYSYFHRAALNMPVANLVAKRHTYDPNRNADGSLTIDIEGLANAWWLDWGWSLTAGKKTDGGAANGTGVDFLTAGTFGLQLYVHLFAFTGTSVTIKVQSSSDDGAGDAYSDVTGATSGALTVAGQGLRVATARNLAIERYLRVVTTGVFSNAVYVASVVVNRTFMGI